MIKKDQFELMLTLIKKLPKNQQTNKQKKARPIRRRWLVCYGLRKSRHSEVGAEGKYGPKTQGLLQSRQCQADFTPDVPQSRERCEITACENIHHQQGSLCVKVKGKKTEDSWVEKRGEKGNQDAAWMRKSLQGKWHWWEWAVTRGNDTVKSVHLKISE